MTSSPGTRTKISLRRFALLFSIFFLIAAGLGYPTLNRFDPRQTPGLSDAKIYAAMVAGTAGADAGHARFRVLVPWIARPIWRIAQGRIDTWDPVMFALLVANSLFVAATAALLIALGTRYFGSYPTALIAALLYLLNFAVPNLRLAGLVDAGEGFFLLALLWSLAEGITWLVPLLTILGTLSKESFLPFCVVFAAAWWLTERRQSLAIDRLMTLSILAGWALSLAALIAVQRIVSGSFTNPFEFGLTLHRGHNYLAHFASSLYDRNLWYVFLWLLPTAIPNLTRMPRPWLVATTATCAMAFVLDAYYGGEPGTIGRALFSISGPTLSLSSAILLAHNS